VLQAHHGGCSTLLGMTGYRGSRVGCTIRDCGRHARHYRRPMLYMVIERFKEGTAPEIYRRFRQRGRMMPEGLEYISSWIDLSFKICWQLMQTEDLALFDKWTANWRDLVDFEIVPVRTSVEAIEIMKSKPERHSSGFGHEFAVANVSTTLLCSRRRGSDDADASHSEAATRRLRSIAATCSLNELARRAVWSRL